MKFQDEIFEISLSLKRSKQPCTGLFEKGKEYLHGKGIVLLEMNIVNKVKLHKFNPLNESYFVRYLIV